LRRKNLRFLSRLFLSYLKGEFFLPDFTAGYPATLHVNIEDGYRGRHIGAKLVETYLAYLKERRVRGVHAGTMSEKAMSFFLGLGFHVLFQGRRSYLRHHVHADLPYYVLGREVV